MSSPCRASLFALLTLLAGCDQQSRDPRGHPLPEMGPLLSAAAEDQQLAGLIMWIPGGLFHLCAALVFLGRWLTRKEGRDAVVAD
jgi:hypothetical protein